MTIDRRTFCGSALAGAALAHGGRAWAQESSATLAPEAMRADLEVLERVYALLHPGLTRYQTSAQFAGRVEAARGWASRPRSQGEFYLALSRLTAAVRCGHSHANPANQSDAVQQGLLGRKDRLPFCTQWIGGRLYVADPLGSTLLRGTELLRIDGVEPRRMLRDMLPLARADGHNDGKRLAQLELHRGDRFAAFDLYRGLLYGAREGSAELRLRLPGGGEQRRTVATDGEGRRGVAAADDPQYGWRFAIDRQGVGRLTMPDWSLYRSKWDWRAFLDRVADELIAERARGLVIDLRDNEGGLDCGDVLLARLIERPVSEAGVKRLVRFRSTPAELRPLLDTWDKSFHTLGEQASTVPGRPGFLALSDGESRRIEPKGKRFAGRVAALVGPTCSSATFGFARLVKDNRLFALVGSETGGNRRGINGGAYFFVRLPATGFEVDCPLIGYFPDRPQPDAGVLPDIAAAPSAADLAAGRDPALERARLLVLG